MKTALAMTKIQHEELMRHLFPGDGKESVVIALCGARRSDSRERIMIHKIVPIPDAKCSVRTPTNVTWPTIDTFVPLLAEAEKKRLSIVKFHSHPTGYDGFSATDDISDKELFTSTHSWLETDVTHISAIVLPNGIVRARSVSSSGAFRFVDLVTVVGDDIEFFWSTEHPADIAVPDVALRNVQAFGKGTYRTLRKLRAGIVGCSGTGSVVFELLKRLNMGEIVIIDPETVEDKNLNRIPQAFKKDADEKIRKVDLLKRNAIETGLETTVYPYGGNLYSRNAVKAMAECDIIFGCMDSVDGRHLLNRLATFYTIPYIDVGVKLEADGEGGVNQICGSVHYLQPGLSTLMSRRLYTEEQLRAAVMKRENPEEYKQRLEEKYISGVNEDRPAVISVNFVFAANAVNDFLARIHKFRSDGNSRFAVETVSIAHGETFRAAESEFEQDPKWIKYIGRGDMEPLLDFPQLSMKDF
ncbi:MAG: ThiF family adenylyltransferase [Bdellovibrionota bacterium]